jgi:hypothetical protein
MNTELFYNSLLAIIKKHSLTDGDLWIVEMFLPIRKTSMFSDTDNLIKDFFNDFNPKKMDISGHAFYDKLIESEFKMIGYIDTDKIIIDETSGEIKLVSEDNDLLFELAPDFSTYLLILVQLADYSIPGFLRHKYLQDDRKRILQIITEILKSDRYLGYYELTFKS